MNDLTREMLERSNKELFEASRRANAVIGQQADEAKVLQGRVDWLEARLFSTRTELKKAVSAGEYVVQLCEANMRAGDSPSPVEAANWSGTVAHCYGAMAFLDSARAALEQS